MKSVLPSLGAIFLPPANEVWGKVISLQASVCPQGGVPDQFTGADPAAGAPSPSRHPPADNARAVRILLECILVYDLFLQGQGGPWPTCPRPPGSATESVGEICS